LISLSSPMTSSLTIATQTPGIPKFLWAPLKMTANFETSIGLVNKLPEKSAAKFVCSTSLGIPLNSVPSYVSQSV